MRKLTALSVLISLVTFGFSAPAHADFKPFESIDPNALAVYSLTPCESPTELDCIESVKTKNSNGRFVNASYQTGAPWTTRTDDFSNTYYDTGTEWVARTSNFSDTFNLYVSLETPAHIIWADADNTFRGGALRVLTWGLPSNIELKVAVRTSWLKPQNVQLVGDNSDFKETSITDGKLWEFTGSPTLVSYYDDWEAAYADGYRGQADQTAPELHFFIHHAGIDDMHSYFPPTCSDHGYTVQAFNSNSAGSPEWNNETHSLDFNIFAPHRDASGNLNQGFFKLWTTDEYINCRWPENTLTTSDNLIAKILNEDGTEQDATVESTHADGKVYLSTTGFHYSSPTIRLISGPAVQAPPVKLFNPDINGRIETNGDLRTIYGTNLSYVTRITANDRQLSIIGSTNSSITFSVDGLIPGTYDLLLKGSQGGLRWLSGLTVKAPAPITPKTTITKKFTPNFTAGSSRLSSAQKLSIKLAVLGAKSLVCQGVIASKSVTLSAKKLAKARATSSCAYAKSIYPALEVKVLGGFLVSKNNAVRLEITR